MAEARKELFGIIRVPEMQGVPVVVVANKQDVPGAMSMFQVADTLGLSEIRDRRWCVQAACAPSGEGIHEAMGEMAKLVKEFQNS